ncbi:type II toxin-antitoxin system HicA family toxin [Dehalogenimonas sp. THU2]|uniref:type II toxin-antitoxin system HicA family toxin n=1 Tax=Dehalogenimonas sp. THU2 TaxID=3151121 RepID=UPI003218D12D
MPSFGPISRKDLVAAPRNAGFDGPFSGARHQMMIKGITRLSIPNPHSANIGRELLSRILKEAGISRDEWEKL